MPKSTPGIWMWVLVALGCLLPSQGAARSVSINCDQVVTDRFLFDGESVNIRLGFPVVDGERIGIHVEPVPNTGSSNVTWELSPASGSCSGVNVGRKDCGPLPPLPSPERYIVAVTGTGVGEFRVHVQRLGLLRCPNSIIPSIDCDIPLDTASDQDVVLGLDLGTSIEYRVDSDLVPFDFVARDGEIVAVDVSRVSGQPAFNPAWRLLDGSGREVPGCGEQQTGRRDCGPLVGPDGPFAVEVFDDAADAIGIYRGHVQRLTASSACDSGACPIERPGDTDLFEITVDDPMNVTIDVRITGSGGGTLFQPAWRLLTRDGTPVVGCEAGTGERSCGPLDPNANPHNVEVFDQAGDSTGEYRITVNGATTACTCTPACQVKPPQCGNGMVDHDPNPDLDEECDEGEVKNGKGQFSESCCTSRCKLRAAGFKCREAGFCQLDAECPGTGSCPPNRPNPFPPCPIPRSMCGNGVVDAPEGEEPEECDLGRERNGREQFGGSCCDAECRERPAGFLCRNRTTVCQQTVQCPGPGGAPPNEGACAENSPEPSDTPCESDSDPCTLDRCSGDGQCVGRDICVAVVPANTVAAKAAKQKGLALNCGVANGGTVDENAQCASEGRASAEQLSGLLAPRIAYQLGPRAVGIPPACEADRIQADLDVFRMCQSTNRLMRDAGSLVTVPCKPTKCLKAYLKAKKGKGQRASTAARLRSIPVEMFAIFSNLGQADDSGIRSAGVVEVRNKKSR